MCHVGLAFASLRLLIRPPRRERSALCAQGASDPESRHPDASVVKRGGAVMGESD
jgi:hypothetical protein